MQEIEKKFLISESAIRKIVDDLSSYNEITQGYIQNVQGRYIYRLKQVINMSLDEDIIARESYFQTIKSKEIKIREEFNVEITREQFTQLWSLCKNMSLTKKRYDIDLKMDFPTKSCIDVYKNTLRGLNIVEVKFETVEDCENFIVPDWFGEEVTNKTEYANYVLVEFGKPKTIEYEGRV